MSDEDRPIREASSRTLQATRGLPTSPLELLSVVLVAGVMVVAGNWGMVLLIAAVIGLLMVMYRIKVNASLTLGENSIAYRVGKITRTIKWSDVSQVALKGNRFVGRFIRVRGPVVVEKGGADETQSSLFDIPNIFGESIDRVFDMICARLASGVKTQRTGNPAKDGDIKLW